MSANSRLTTAVHALCWLELARRRGRPTLTSAEIADSLASNPVLVRRVLGPLRDRGVLHVVGRGPGAGWRLGRDAGDLTVADVLDALDPAPAPFELHAHEPRQTCPVGFGLRPVLADVYAESAAAMRETLARHTIADVLDTTLARHPLPEDPAG